MQCLHRFLLAYFVSALFIVEYALISDIKMSV